MTAKAINKVHVRLGKTWKEKKGNGILVIVPGAGSFANKKAYDSLKKKFAVTFYDTPTRKGGFVYPDDWGEITKVPLSIAKPGDNNLMGLALEIGEEVTKSPPELIICGSRGGQVVLPVLLQHFWRGPFIAINAGPLTSKSMLPKECVPVFVTCGKDYFSTKSPTYVEKRFKQLSGMNGTNVFLPHEGHMPQLSSQFLVNLANHLLNGSSIPTTSSQQVFLLNHKLTSSSSELTIDNNKGHKITLLRKRATEESDWYSDKRKLSNGDKVEILKSGFDENNHEMLYVSDSSQNITGWLYAINIKELR